jgi:PAS domain S-box-containing protein
MVSAEVLKQRPSRLPDYAAEAQALLALAQSMAVAPEGILKKLAETALAVCRAHSAGLSLLEDSDQRKNFHWRAIAGDFSPHLNGGTPRDFGPCGTVLDRNAAQLCSHPEVDFPYLNGAQPPLEEILLVPFYIKGQAVGTIWVISHDTQRRFDAEDLRMMTSLGVFASAAYQTYLSLNSTQQVAAIVESSDDAIISKNLDGIITSWNRGAQAIFGYSPEEVIGKPVSILIPTERQDEEPSILKRLRRGERIDHYETVRRRKDGTLIDISLTISPVRDPSGAIVGASKIASDITERRRAETQIAEVAAIVESSDDAIISKNLDGIIRSWNRGAQKLFGYSAEEVIGKPVSILIPPDRHNEEPEILQRLRRGERIEHYETVRRRKDGSFVEISLTISPVRNAAGTIIGASKIARDISERKHSQAQIAILAGEAEHRAKNVLATVQATVQLTRSDTVEGFKEAIQGRIQALANVHQLFVETRWTGAEISSLVKEELSPYSRDNGARVRIAGPKCVLEPSAAQAIAVTLHELATNAAKYGALSVPEGHIQVEWSSAPAGPTVLRWIEAGGPPVKPAKRKGFGSRVMDSMIRNQLKGEMRFDWRSEGIVCEITLPAARAAGLKNGLHSAS